ncbi:MAG: hypothetical protein COB37_05280 [Kordiimonadales bacterium]|nr:MAG: hypothetical protein COB37_05280 [Kordiimonadales bacterium]
MNKSVKHLAIACVVSALSALSPANANNEMPLEAFAALPSFSNARLSPNGEKIAYSISARGRKHILFQNVDGTGQGIIAPPNGWELNNYHWANENTLILSTGKLLDRDAFASEAYNTRLFSYLLKEQKYVWLGKPKVRRGRQTSGSSQQRVSQQETITDYLYQNPKYILVSLDFNLDSNPEVFRVNVRTGKRKRIRQQITGVNTWYTDHTSTVRAGFGYTGISRDIWFGTFRNAEGNWISIAKQTWSKKYYFIGFSADPNILYVGGNSKYGTDAVYTLDARTGEIVAEVFSHPTVDMDYVAKHPATGHLVGVGYTDDYSRIKYFDKTLRKIQRSINKVLKGTVNTLVGRASNKELYLFYVHSDTNPGQYYIYDREKGTLGYIALVRDGIDINQTASTTLVSVPVRDGTNIPGYLTVPKGLSAKNLPTIIMPHGGPGARDDASWGYKAQFYANRGYLVLKPQFRGSTGYGDAFFYKGRHQWGGLMQDDITDATRWLISEGMSDPERICIVGASFGGYAALMGVIKEPGLYKCAISVNGVADIPRLKNNDKKSVGGKAWIKKMGLKGAKDETVSPYHRAQDVSAPVLLISSKDDQRVPYKMSKAMHQQLKKLKKPSVYVEVKDGGHSMVSEAARLTLLRETEAFLAKHIGGE